MMRVSLKADFDKQFATFAALLRNNNFLQPVA